MMHPWYKLIAITIWCSLLSQTEQAALKTSIKRVLSDVTTERRWYDRKCKITMDPSTGEKINWFHVPDHSYVQCSVDTCPTRSKNKFNVDHCSICCWADLIGECVCLYCL